MSILPEIQFDLKRCNFVLQGVQVVLEAGFERVPVAYLMLQALVRQLQRRVLRGDPVQLCLNTSGGCEFRWRYKESVKP